MKIFNPGDEVELNSFCYARGHGSWRKGSKGIVLYHDIVSDVLEVKMEDGNIDGFRPEWFDLVQKPIMSGLGAALGLSGGLSQQAYIKPVESKQPCNHVGKWKPYIGLTRKFEYCTGCDKKRNEGNIYD